jgi:hypothetical protein
MAVTMPAVRRAKTEDREVDDDLMRRLVEAVEKYTTQAEADRAAKDVDRKREINAVGAVFWALFGLAWLASVQRGAVSHFVTSNWGALPVLIPLFGIVAAFAYRAFRLKVFKVSLVYAAVGAVVLTEVIFMLDTNNMFVRVLNIVLGYVGVWYFVLGASNLDDDEVSGQVINTFVNRQHWIPIAVVLVLMFVGTVWYMLSAETGLELALSATLLAVAVLFVVIRAEWSRLGRVLSGLRRPPAGR